MSREMEPALPVARALLPWGRDSHRRAHSQGAIVLEWRRDFLPSPGFEPPTLPPSVGGWCRPPAQHSSQGGARCHILTGWNSAQFSPSGCCEPWRLGTCGRGGEGWVTASDSRLADEEVLLMASGEVSFSSGLPHHHPPMTPRLGHPGRSRSVGAPRPHPLMPGAPQCDSREAQTWPRLFWRQRCSR